MQSGARTPDPAPHSHCSWRACQPCAAPRYCRDLSCPGTCNVPLKGRLTPGLQLLPNLQILDLSSNGLSGPLPTEWGNNGSFPALQPL